MKRQTTIISLAILFILTPSLTWAQRGPRSSVDMPRGQWWTDSQIVQKLALTEKQIQKISQIAREGQKEHVKSRANTEVVEIDMEAALSSKEFNADKLTSLINEFVKTRSESEKQRIMTLIKIRQVLTQDQYLKLKASRSSQRGRSKRGFNSERQRRPQRQGNYSEGGQRDFRSGP